MVTTISHIMSKSRIHALKSLSESFSVYCVLIGEPASGKSPAMRIVKNALISLDNHRGIAPHQSSIICPATVEGLLHYMKQYGH